jgi:mycothiol synthase
VGTGLPAGFSMRAPATADGPGLVAMLNEESEALIGVPLADLDWVMLPWTAPGADLERDFAVFEGRGGALAGYLIVDWHPADGEAFSLGVVAMAFHGQGLGAAIVREAERRGLRRAEEIEPDRRVVIRVGSLADEPRVSGLLASLGYREVRRFWRMTRTFDGPPQPPAAIPGIELRPFAEGDGPAAAACAVEAFADHWGPAGSPDEWLHTHVEASQTFHPELWTLAWEGEALAGVLVAEAPSTEDPNLGYVVELGVLRPFRGRGIGEAMLRDAFVKLHGRGMTGVYLYVDSESETGATRLYERVGMSFQPRFATWEKELRAGR